MKQMLSLGGFVFSLGEKTPYVGLKRSSDGGFRSVARYGQKPIGQNTGQSLESISLTGEWFKSEGADNIARLRALQNQRKPLVLADGYGNNLGLWTIKKLDESQSRIIDDGTPMVLSFTLGLEEYVGESIT